MAARQSEALGRHGRLRSGLVSVLRNQLPRQFTQLEARIGGRLSDVADDAMLAYVTQLLEAAVEADAIQAPRSEDIADLADALAEHGIVVPPGDDLKRWAHKVRELRRQKGAPSLRPMTLAEAIAARQTDQVGGDPSPIVPRPTTLAEAIRLRQQSSQPSSRPTLEHDGHQPAPSTGHEPGREPDGGSNEFGGGGSAAGDVFGDTAAGDRGASEQTSTPDVGSDNADRRPKGSTKRRRRKAKTAKVAAQAPVEDDSSTASVEDGPGPQGGKSNTASDDSIEETSASHHPDTAVGGDTNTSADSDGSSEGRVVDTADHDDGGGRDESHDTTQTAVADGSGGGAASDSSSEDVDETADSEPDVADVSQADSSVGDSSLTEQGGPSEAEEDEELGDLEDPFGDGPDFEELTDPEFGEPFDDIAVEDAGFDDIADGDSFGDLGDDFEDVDENIEEDSTVEDDGNNEWDSWDSQEPEPPTDPDLQDSAALEDNDYDDSGSDEGIGVFEPLDSFEPSTGTFDTDADSTESVWGTGDDVWENGDGWAVPTPPQDDTAVEATTQTPSDNKAADSGDGDGEKKQRKTISTQRLRPEMLLPGAEPVKKSRRKRRVAKKAAVPPGADSDADSIDKQMEARLRVAHPVFERDLESIYGAEAIAAWGERVRGQKKDFAFISAKTRHRADYGELVVVKQNALEQDLTYASLSQSVWGRIMAKYRGAKLYELAIVHSSCAESIISCSVGADDSDEVCLLRLNQPRGVVGVLVVLGDDLTEGSPIREALVNRMEELLRDQLDTICVLTSNIRGRGDDPTLVIERLVKALEEEGRARKWSPSCPVVAGASWKWARNEASAMMQVKFNGPA